MNNLEVRDELEELEDSSSFGAKFKLGIGVCLWPGRALEVRSSGRLFRSMAERKGERRKAG